MRRWMRLNATNVLTTNNGHFHYSVELMRRWRCVRETGSSAECAPVA